MFTGGIGSDGTFQGSSHKNIDPGVTWTSLPRGTTQESKAADKVVNLLDKMSFDETSFAHNLVSTAGNNLRRRVLDIAIAIIKTYAIQWEVGLYQDDVARDAMRLKDTCDQFKM